MARVQPSATELTDPFWDATRTETYLVQWCAPCQTPIFYPREVCPRCLSAEGLEWRRSAGTGTVHAVSVQHRPANPTMADRVPYVVVLIDLDAGAADRGGRALHQTVRIMSNVVNSDPYAVKVGDPVILTWEPLTDGRNLPVFEPAGTQGATP